MTNVTRRAQQKPFCQIVELEDVETFVFKHDKLKLLLIIFLFDI